MASLLTIPVTASITEDMFDKTKNYNKVLIQKGKPVLDAEYNEMQDNLLLRIKEFMKSFDSFFVEDGFKVIEHPSNTTNDFTVTTGIGYIEGEMGYLTADLDYKDQTETNSYLRRFYWGADAVVPVLTTPTGNRDDLVVANFVIREVTAAEDNDIKNVNLNIETARRMKVCIGFTVLEDMTYPDIPVWTDEFAYYNDDICFRAPIAWIHRLDGDATIVEAMIEDIRHDIMENINTNAGSVDNCDVNDAGDTNADLWTAAKIIAYVEDIRATLDSEKEDVIGYTPENQANKENTTMDTSTTKYPTNKLAKEYADSKVTNTAISGSESTTVAPSRAATKSYVDTGLAAKQNSLGYTAENSANKSASVSTDETKYPTNNAVKSYVDNGLNAKENVANKKTTITTSDTEYPSCNAVRIGLASKHPLLVYTPEDVANKKTSINNSDTEYPTSKAVLTGLGGKVSTTGHQPNSIFVGDSGGQVTQINHSGTANKYLKSGGGTGANGWSTAAEIFTAAVANGTTAQVLQGNAGGMPTWLDKTTLLAGIAVITSGASNPSVPSQTGDTGSLYYNSTTGVLYILYRPSEYSGHWISLNSGQIVLGDGNYQDRADSFAGNAMHFVKFRATATSVHKLCFYFYRTLTNTKISMALYNDSAPTSNSITSKPSTRIVVANNVVDAFHQLSSTTPEQTLVFPLPNPTALTIGNYYWIALIGNTNFDIFTTLTGTVANRGKYITGLTYEDNLSHFAADVSAWPFTNMGRYCIWGET